MRFVALIDGFKAIALRSTLAAADIVVTHNATVGAAMNATTKASGTRPRVDRVCVASCVDSCVDSCVVMSCDSLRWVPLGMPRYADVTSTTVDHCC